MDKLTLDTNILRDWAWCEDKSTETRYPANPEKRDELIPQFKSLVEITTKKVCELGVSNIVYVHFEESLPNHILELINTYNFDRSSISIFPMTFPFTFIDSDQIDEIFSVVFPNSNPEHKQYITNKKDAEQLLAHKTAGRDFFITSDKEILRANNKLQENLGISVITLSEYLTSKTS